MQSSRFRAGCVIASPGDKSGDSVRPRTTLSSPPGCDAFGFGQIGLYLCLRRGRVQISLAHAGGILPTEGRNHGVSDQRAPIVEAGASARAWLHVPCHD